MRKWTLLPFAVALVLVAGASAGSQAAHPRCAVKDPEAPILLKGDGSIGAKGQTYMWGEFLNTCKDPVLAMGSFACLEEYDYPGAHPRLIECYTNEDKSPFTMIAPHSTDIFLLAKCDYTTIHRYYRITGHAWAVALPTEGGQTYSKRGWETPFAINVNPGKGDIHFCHLTAAGTHWRSFRFG